MRTTSSFFSDSQVRQGTPTCTHHTCPLHASCRHRILWRILAFLLATCIGSLQLSPAIAQLASPGGQGPSPIAQNDPQRAAEELLLGPIDAAGDTLCSLQGNNGVQGELGDRSCNLGDAVQRGDPQAPAALQATAWEEVATQGTFSVEASNQQFINLAGRLRALRLGATGLDLRGLAFNFSDNTIPASRLLASAGGDRRYGCVNGQTARGLYQRHAELW
jgi:hypothetical protein